MKELLLETVISNSNGNIFDYEIIVKNDGKLYLNEIERCSKLGSLIDLENIIPDLYSFYVRDVKNITEDQLSDIKDVIEEWLQDR